jgi:hypothetical protein
VMDNGRDSVHLLQRWLEGPGARIPLVVVLNEVRGESFDLLDASGLLALASGRGARTLRLHRLSDAPLQKIDAAGHSFWAAQQGGALSLLDRQRVRVWLQRTSADLDALGV